MNKHPIIKQLQNLNYINRNTPNRQCDNGHLYNSYYHNQCPHCGCPYYENYQPPPTKKQSRQHPNTA